MCLYSTLFSVRAPVIETTNVVDDSQDISLAEAQSRLQQTEADLLQDALTYQRGSGVVDDVRPGPPNHRRNR